MKKTVSNIAWFTWMAGAIIVEIFWAFAGMLFNIAIIIIKNFFELRYYMSAETQDEKPNKLFEDTEQGVI